MLYNDFKGLKLSALGFGAMRLPVGPRGDSDVLVNDAETMIDYAYNNGVNYFDTAWGYHFGKSELVVGKCLNKYPRDSYYLATKFPGYDLANMNKVQWIFEKQLQKCKTEYFDFYLLHNVYEKNIDSYLDEQYNIVPYLLEQKRQGRIRHLGFSCHGAIDILKRFLDVYGDEMEFCQIQLNYLDWNFEDAKAKVELLNNANIPIWVMEPIRGGRLASLSDEAKERLEALRPNETFAGWAFRFLQSIPGIKMILSGMSNLEQVKANVEIFSENKPLDDDEFKTIVEVGDSMVNGKAVPCTACRYCTAECPQELDIPRLLYLYNELVITEGGFLAPMAVEAMPDDKKPSACLECGACEAVCPQQISIPETLKVFADKLGLNK